MLGLGSHPLRTYARVFVLTTTSVGGGLFFVNQNVGDVHTVRGDSMTPTLSPTYFETGNADRVFLTKWYPAENLKRGDIVSFWAPHKPEQLNIKRVIGLQGDLIRPDKRYLRKQVTVPHGHVWIEGDNWRRTYDSNDYGPIPMGLIHGKARAVVWPPHRFGTIEDKRTKITRVSPGYSELPIEYRE